MSPYRSTERFTDRVTYYVRGRPRYPAALLRFFQDELGLTPAHAMADVGSGTGFLSELFVRNGNLTYAVEPNDAMRSAAEEAFGNRSNFHSVAATAEATTLADASVNFVTAGQAFHWFDPPRARVEFRRILAPGGFVALVWNDRRLDGSPFAAEYQRLIAEHRTESTSANWRHNAAAEAEKLRDFFGVAGFRTQSFENEQRLDRAALVDRVTSTSYMPMPPDPRHDAVLQAANAIFDRHQENGAVVMPYDTKVYFGKL
jgi:SAM-dependent methyltransferase